MIDSHAPATNHSYPTIQSTSKTIHCYPHYNNQMVGTVTFQAVPLETLKTLNLYLRHPFYPHPQANPSIEQVFLLLHQAHIQATLKHKTIQQI